MKNRILYLTRNTIPYVKELQPLTGDVAGCILMQQLDYWFERYPNGFWKFLEPCAGHAHYRKGTSWCEELGFSVAEFRVAFDRIGLRHKSKAKFDAINDKFDGKFYCSYLDRQQNLTFYFRNHELVDAALDSLIFNRSQSEVPPIVSGSTPTFPVNAETQFTVNSQPASTVNAETTFAVNRGTTDTEVRKLNSQEIEKLHLLNTDITGSEITQIPQLLPTVPAQPADTASGSGVFDLIYPLGLTPIEQKAVEGMVLAGDISWELQQQLLDELAGAIQAKSIKRGVVPFTHGLISAAHAGKFTPSLGVAVLAKRNAMQEIHSNEVKGKAKFILDPVSMSKGEEMIAAVRQRSAKTNKPAQSGTC